MSFEKLNGVKVAVIGDFCLDTYWYADMTKSVLSRETPHYPLPICREVMSPGGAGNVAANISALRIEKVYAIGVRGDDWRGDCLEKVLIENGVDTSLFVKSCGRFTNTYIKPMKYGYSGQCFESARLDFEAVQALDEKSENEMLEKLSFVADKVDVICVCDQMAHGCITEKVREKICELGKGGKRVIVDSRDRIALYKYVTVKPNEIEAARATGFENEEESAKALEKETCRPSIVTCGDRGCYVCEDGCATLVPAFIREGEIDFCGAGDTFLSAFACFSAAGYKMADAARHANAASCVTVHKVGTTGTASREEIEKILG
ncbi:MAG: sugar kinase [Clostridia bacterium]|nr:sugar kinase [Clostridia bacterium]